MFSEIAFFQHLIDDIGRKGEVLLHNGILPGDGILRKGRIVIIVPFPHDAVIDGMVQERNAQRTQATEFRVILRQETHVQVGGLQLHPAGLGRI